MAEKVVLAYSGGLDTSIILKWLQETYGYEVVCFCADIGQEEELAGVPEKAAATGASKCYVVRFGRGVRHRFHLPEDPGRRDL
jgi:argininosuccinate synthase